MVWTGSVLAAAYNRTVVSIEKGKPQRVLGLDVGARRIGLAVTDPLGITAQGLETLERRNKKHDFAYLNRILREYDVKEIVVGLPLRMSGQEGTQSEKIRIFAEELVQKFGLPVHFWDERLTSAEANRFLRDSELSIEKRAKAVDRMAAVLILQGWMERKGLNSRSSELDQEKSAEPRPPRGSVEGGPHGEK
jgi:putative holliday junction resolvase